MVATIGFGLAAGSKSTSKKGAEQCLPGSIQVMSASVGNGAHVSDNVQQALLKRVLGTAPSVSHLQCIGITHERSTRGQYRVVEGSR